jgi:hypothetical protein
MADNFNNNPNNNQQQNGYAQPQYNQPQYNQQQYNQPQYNQPQQYVAPAQPADDSKGLAIASLVLGIVSLVCCGSVCSIVGLVLGIMSRKRKPENNGMATAGIVLSIISLAFWGVYLILYAVGSVALPYNF